MNRNIPSGGNRQIGTASRLTTGMRPTSKGTFNGNTVLNQPLKIEDRIMTQQGLRGPKTSKGSRRQVEDKNYYLGILRGKINEITNELRTLNQQIVEAKEESSSYLQYEQMAEKLALEIKSLQGELGDYNTLVDKMNTNEDMRMIEMDYEELRATNQRAEKSLEHLFEEKKAKESQSKSCEVELEQERRMAESVVSNMSEELKHRYETAKEENEHFLKQSSILQEKLDKLYIRKVELEEELEQSYIKQQAMQLYNELGEVELKRDQLVAEENTRGDPQKERERLLKQVKDDNIEISSIERQIKEYRDHLEILQDELVTVERDLEDNQGEQMQKYRDLKKREEQMDEFLSNFDHNKEIELTKLESLETEITSMLERISRSMTRMGQVPTEEELRQIQDQLLFKSSEVSKSESTASNLTFERTKLAQDLAKVDQLENKITLEMKTLTEKIKNMEKEIEIYSDLDKVKRVSEENKRKLIQEKDVLTRRRDYMKKLTQHLSSKYEAARIQLDENDTQAQLVNLEKKWQHLEQNNFVMKEFIATKSMESDYMNTINSVKKIISDLNEDLKQSLSSKSSL